MTAQKVPAWTGDFVKKLHLFKISNIEVAKQLDCTKEYVSRILNGKDTPKNAEQRFNEALNELIAEQSKTG